MTSLAFAVRPPQTARMTVPKHASAAWDAMGPDASIDEIRDRLERSRYYLSIGETAQARREALILHLEHCQQELADLQSHLEGARRLVADWQYACDAAHAQLMTAPSQARGRLLGDLQAAEMQIASSRSFLGTAERSWADGLVRLLPQIEQLTNMLGQIDPPAGA